MRYEGQGHDLRVALPDGDVDGGTVESVVERFSELYEERYGPATQLPEARVEIVSAICEGFGSVTKHPRFEEDGADRTVAEHDAEKRPRDVYWDRSAEPVSTRVYDGMKLQPGAKVEGPTLIDLPDTTVVVRAGQRVHKNRYGDYELFFGEVARDG